VHEATTRLLRLARDERQPSVLECMTYRYRGHSVADPGKVYRPAEEIERWRARDPIVLFGEQLREQGLLDDAAAKEIADEVEREVQAAVDFALQSPDPDPADLYEHMYGAEAVAQFGRMAPGAPFGERSISAVPLASQPTPGSSPVSTGQH
jgi:pyruvate dehydrogenase E1 component alpha subunit